MKAIIAGAVFLPLTQIAAGGIRKELTVEHWKMGEESADSVYAFDQYDDYLAVPRDYGLKLISKLGLRSVDRMARGFQFPFPRNVEHTGEFAYQHDFVNRILASTERFNDFLVHAATGKGKTVCSLSVIQKLGRNALVLVDQDNLMQQWKAQAKAVLGLSDKDIGTVQGAKCDYKGKAVTIAMVQSLVQRQYDDEFYDYFGTVVVDEVHTAGAPTFSQALMMFSAVTRFGVSATVDRRDSLQKILHWNLGAVQVELLDKHDKSYVYYLESGTVYSWYANVSPKTGRILSEVAEDTNRNMLLADGIKFMHEAGRDILVISDRIEQLEDLKAMCGFLGIPDEEMGLYCGFRSVWGFEKDPKPKRAPYGYVRGTEYTPVKFGPLRKRIPKKALDAVKASARVLFATFGMFTKGVDVPRLSAGFDCTPRSKAQQVHGRILRKLDGKFVPIWVTVRDYNSYRLEHQFLQRVSEYVESSAEIYKWKMEKGVRFQDVRELKRDLHDSIKELKALNILTQLDGNNTLVIPDTPRSSGKPPGQRTGKTTR